MGFELIESRDAATAPNPGGEAWYKILTPSYFSLFRIQFTPIGAPPAPGARLAHAHPNATATPAAAGGREWARVGAGGRE